MNKELVFSGLFILLATLASAQTLDSASGSSAPVAAVSRDSLGLDTLQRIDSGDNGLVTIRRAAGGGDVVLEVAGFGITLGQAPRSVSAKKPRPLIKGTFIHGVEMGFNTLTGLDYSDYPAGTGNFLDTRNGNSFHLGVTIVGLTLKLDRMQRFEFSTGLRYTIDNYRLTDNAITLARTDGRILPVPLDEKADKSKFRITSLGIPLQFSFEPVRHLRLALVGYCDFALGSKAIYKRPKEKEVLSGVNPFQFGVGGSVSYRGFGVYARYGVTRLFKSDAGPGCHPVSFGVCLFM